LKFLVQFAFFEEFIFIIKKGKRMEGATVEREEEEEAVLLEQEGQQQQIQWQSVEARGAQRCAQLFESLFRDPRPGGSWLSPDGSAIDLSWKRLTRLPDDLLSYLHHPHVIPSITHLDLSCNQLTKIDAGIFGSPSLRGLVCLDLRGCAYALSLSHTHTA
jgi:hypothetical protein